ncbi:GroES-like protein [Wilcoxina mikolae CBS 423.85]|nr:GroES-like protein [Wilcoxina mikolae CBS 423.85]
MALNAASNLVETVLGRDSSHTVTSTEISNPDTKDAAAADPSEKMQALVWMGKNDVRVVETSKPKLVEPTDVIIKVTGTTVCGSDMHLLHGVLLQLQKGDILGHEFCGIVEQVGSAVKDLKLGERVVNSFVVSCGSCRFCKQNLTTACERTNASSLHEQVYGSRTAGIFGYSHFVGGYAGGQAEYVRIPFADQNLLKLPDSVPDEKGLYLSDVLATSYHAIQDTAVYKDDVVAIWGLGPIGLLAAIFAFRAGASRVIGIDNNFRTSFAEKKIPGIEVINYSSLPRGRTVTAEIRGRVPGGVDVSIEAAGGEYAKGWAHYFELTVGAENDTSELINEAITSTRNFGRVGIIADYVGFTNHFNIGSLMERGIRLIGCGQTPVQKYWPELLRMVESGEVDPGVIVTHRIRFEDIAKAYYMHDKKEDGMVKVFAETKFSQPRAEGINTPELTKL